MTYIILLIIVIVWLSIITFIVYIDHDFTNKINASVKLTDIKFKKIDKKIYDITQKDRRIIITEVLSCMSDDEVDECFRYVRQLKSPKSIRNIKTKN